ncbi:SH3 domain-containing protein [Streptomyces sp. NPDC048639]|uniref:SH3 domain-containing protein n=1 Tax=Streptomyces sp. NPDC048639 TaxID=3365581 RepID=UPI00370F816D
MHKRVRLGVAAVVAIVSAGVGMSSAHADDRHKDSVPITIYGDNNTVVYGDHNSIAGRDNLVGSGHTAGTGHDVGGPGAEDPGTPARPYGRVVSPAGINLRERPTTNSEVRGTLAYGDEVGLSCKVHGQSIDGNDLWYRLRDRTVWAAARYVQNFGDVPFCPSQPALSPADLQPVEQDWNSTEPLG